MHKNYEFYFKNIFKDLYTSSKNFLLKDLLDYYKNEILEGVAINSKISTYTLERNNETSNFEYYTKKCYFSKYSDKFKFIYYNDNGDIIYDEISTGVFKIRERVIDKDFQQEINLKKDEIKNIALILDELDDKKDNMDIWYDLDVTYIFFYGSVSKYNENDLIIDNYRPSVVIDRTGKNCFYSIIKAKIEVDEYEESINKPKVKKFGGR